MARDTFTLRIQLEGGGRSEVEINEFPDECPLCREGGEPKYILGHSLGREWDYDEVIEAVFQCPKNKCKRFYIAYYGKSDRMGRVFRLRRKLAPHYWVPKEFSDEIENICPSFERIYNQAAIAEGFGLDEICGGGYRKALEFLVKDCLISTKVKTKKQIIGLMLGEAIVLIKDKNIQACAKRAAWLGNDELHYTRVWGEKDIENLKELIKLTVHWVESEIITKEYEKDMPVRRKIKK